MRQMTIREYSIIQNGFLFFIESNVGRDGDSLRAGRSGDRNRWG
jgi:hypothetical protein